jgi:hypothetical protein
MPRRRKTQWPTLVLYLVIVAALGAGYVLKKRRDVFIAYRQKIEAKRELSAMFYEGGLAELHLYRTRLSEYREKLKKLEELARIRLATGDLNPRSLASARIDIKTGNAEVDQAYEEVLKLRARADYYEQLKRQYDYAVSHPWVSLPEDLPEK